MFTLKHKFLIALAGGMVVLSACEKNISVPLNEQKLANSYMKVHIATVGALRNYLFINERQINGSALASGGTFPLTGLGTAFDENNLFGIQLGQLSPIAQRISIRDTSSTATQPVTNFVTNLEPNSQYTLFLTDSVNRPGVKFVKDNVEKVQDTTARIRFANLPFSTVAIPNIDLFSTKANANIFTNIPVNEVTAFRPFASALNDTLQVRATGTLLNLASFNGIVATQKRSYTIVFRGSYRNPTGRFLSSFLTF